MPKHSTAETIRVFVVHHQVLFRESLSRLLAAEPGIAVCGQGESLSAAAEALEQTKPEVLIVEIDAVAAESPASVRALAKAVRLLALADSVAPAHLLTALNLGVVGIFFNDGPPDALLQAIRMVAGGSAWVDYRVVALLAEQADPAAQAAKIRRRGLTAREEDVLRGVCDGLSNRSIAGLLQVSESSIKSTLRHLFRKLGVHTRSQLVRMAMENEWKPLLKRKAGWETSGLKDSR